MKTYLTRTQSKALSAWDTVGDPTGGAAYGEYRDPATAIVGASVLNGVMGANAAQSAASTQAGAAQNAAAAQQAATTQSNQLQWNMYNQNLANQAPYMAAGQTALGALMGGLGLAGGTGGGQYGPAGSQTASFGGSPLATQVAAPGGGGMFGSAIGAAPTSTAGTASGINGVTTNPTTNYGASAGAVNNAANAYQGAFTQNFTPSMLNMDPSYQFRLNQGTQNLNASAAARGLLGSGQNLKDITDYGQQAASQQYQQAFQNYNTQQSNLYNRIASLAGVGSSTAQNLGQAGQTTGSNIANTTMAGTTASNNYLTSGAAASAAGQVGQVNALTGAASSGMNTWMGLQNLNNTQNYLNNLSGGSVSAATPYNTVNMTGFQTPTSTPWSTTTTPGLGSGTALLD